ncbi:MAG: ROK family protein [Planctomycetota bacterium]
MSDTANRDSGDSSERDLWIGIDLGGTKMFACVCDSNFEVIGRKRKSTKGHQGADAGVDRVQQTIRQAIDDADVSVDRIAGIGFAAPGPLDLIDGVILETPNLGWRNVPICRILEKEFGCPVTLLNDVDAGVYGECQFGVAQGASSVIGLFPGTGIGGGFVRNGDILSGSRYSCFEIGHFRVHPDGPLCGCGRRGCLEAVASRLAIGAACAKAVYRGQAPKLKEIAGTDLSDIRSGALKQAIKEGDEVVERIVRDAARQLGTAAGSIVNLLHPDIILLGGGLVEALPDLYVSEVQRAADDQIMPSFRKSFRVCVSELGDYAAIKGAAAWAKLKQAEAAA